MDRVLLFSGGLDSFIAWELLGHPPCLYVSLGHRYEQDELAAIEKLQLKHRMTILYDEHLRLGDLEGSDGYIPFRNLLLATAGALRANTVYLGALAGEASQDKTAGFFRDTSKLLSTLRGRKVEVLAPFRHLTKTELVREYLTPGFCIEALFDTRSCYTPGATACGVCQACFRRWVAMSNNGLVEPYVCNPALTTWTANTVVSSLRSLHPSQWGEVGRNNLDAMRALVRAGKRFP